MGVAHSMGDNTVETFTNKEYLLESIKPLLELRKHTAGANIRHPLTAKYKPKEMNLNPKKRVAIDDLDEEMTLVGQYLLCRTIAPPTKLTAIVLIVEDPEGEKAVRVCIYEYHDEDKRRPNLDDIFPVGTILAIRNPWFKMNLDGGYSVRVEGSVDLLILSGNCFKKNFPRLQWKSDNAKFEKSTQEKEKPAAKANETKKKISKAEEAAIEWKNKGNKHFVSHDYAEAYECYTAGLKEDSKNVDILSNRSATSLRLGYFHRALEDSTKALNVNPDHTKALYRKAKALANLERYGDAIKFLENKMIELPDLKRAEEFKTLLMNLRKLEKEQSTGNHNFMSFFSGESLDAEEIADYQGPVEISAIPGKGLGLVATKDIPAGTLLLVSKAFAMVSEADLENELLLLDSDEDAITRKALVKMILEKLKVEPEWGKQIFALHGGKDVCEENEDHSGDSQKVVEAICHYNANPGKKSPLKVCLKDLWSKYFKDEEICDSDSDEDEDDDDQNNFGLWITPSYINHSCWDANCIQLTFGNVLIIRSIKDISKEEEILRSYIQPTETFYQRKQFCQNLGFVCTCTVCEMERSVPHAFIRERKGIFNIIKFCMEKPLLLTTQISRLESMTWPTKNENNAALNTTLLFAYERLGFVQVIKGDLDAAADAYIKAYNLAKETPMIILTANYAMKVVTVLLCAKKKKLAKRWKNVLARQVLIAFGPKWKDALKVLAQDSPIFAEDSDW